VAPWVRKMTEPVVSAFNDLDRLMATSPKRHEGDATNTQPRYTITTVAEMTGVPAQQLRRMEKAAIIAPARSVGRTRRYSDADVALVERARELALTGVNQVGIERIMALESALHRATERAIAAEAEVSKIRHELHAPDPGDVLVSQNITSEEDMRLTADLGLSNVAPPLERVAVQQAERWYRRRYNQEAQAHVVIGLQGKPAVSVESLWIDVVGGGQPPHRVTVSVDMRSGFVHPLAQPVVCLRCP
jgi:MerR family transcriptional regulator/heat shock protein HspR